MGFERRELIDSGWSTNFVATKYGEGEMLAAAQCYITLARRQEDGKGEVGHDAPRGWPLHLDWNPSVLPKNNILKAMALLSWEWDRLHATGG